MPGKKVFITGLLAVLLFMLLLLAAGCGGHDSYFRDEQPTPLSSDVIVIGDSTAALVAALEASRHGASVLVFFDQQHMDSWLFDEGCLAAGDDEEAAASPAELKEALMAFGGGKGQSWHYNLLAENTASDLAWLCRETGLELALESPLLSRPVNLSVELLYEQLYSAALDEGVRFMAGTKVLELIIEDRNIAAGIRFNGENETVREAYAPAVILADGGILSHEALMKKLAPAVGAASWRRGQVGMGWQAAMRAGLDLVDTNLFSYAPAIEENGSWIKARWPAGTLLVAGDSLVPLDGLTDQEVALQLLNCDGQSGHLVVAESYLGSDTNLSWPRFAGIDALMKTYHIDLPSLRLWYLQPWDYFYGIPVKAVAEYCLGGIAVNQDGEALRRGERVQGLYAVGEIAGRLHGEGLMPGAAFSEAVVWGRIVGRNAAELAQR